MYAQSARSEFDQDISATQNRATSQKSPIRLQPWQVGVENVAKLLENGSLWNQHDPRREQYVHGEVSDIWVRYNAWENYNGDLAAFNGPHIPEWYPIAYAYPALIFLVNDVLGHLQPVELGGVLITKIPPGQRVLPHSDHGWHAERYNDKFAVQIKGNAEQAFCFEDAQLSAMPGQVYQFDNSQVHWVTNDSDEDRITMIICTRERE